MSVAESPPLQPSGEPGIDAPDNWLRQYIPDQRDSLELAEAIDSAALLRHIGAVASLHPYAGHQVVERRSVRVRGETEYGTFYEEKVRFADNAVRTLTRGVPKRSYFASREGVIPNPITATDALYTGPDGLNAYLIQQFVELGYPVEWLHHQGRHSLVPRTPKEFAGFARYISRKSVGRSAHHQHGLLDDLAETADYDASQIIVVGDSRGAMTGEAIDALANMYGRGIIWSDYIASCFEHQPSLAEMKYVVEGLITMPIAGLKLYSRLKKAHAANPDAMDPRILAGTLDPHPMNLLHELAWAKPLLSGDAGRFADAVPLERHGARTYLSGDGWSRGDVAWQEKHSIRPDLHFILKDRPDGTPANHLDLADSFIQDDRTARLSRLAGQIRVVGNNLDRIDYQQVMFGTGLFYATV